MHCLSCFSCFLFLLLFFLLHNFDTFSEYTSIILNTLFSHNAAMFYQNNARFYSYLNQASISIQHGFTVAMVYYIFSGNILWVSYIDIVVSFVWCNGTRITSCFCHIMPYVPTQSPTQNCQGSTVPYSSIYHFTLARSVHKLAIYIRLNHKNGTFMKVMWWYRILENILIDLINMTDIDCLLLHFIFTELLH